PEGYADAKLEPAAAYYNQDLKEFVLPYEAVRSAESPDETLLSFLQSSYEAAAGLARWDRQALEWTPPSRTGARGGAARRRVHDAVEQHPDHHRDHEDHRGGMTGHQRGDPRAWAEAAQAPADPEQGGAQDQGWIDVDPIRSAEARPEPRAHAPPPEPTERQEVDPHGASEDEHEARIPVARHVEEADHLGGLGHAAEHQPRSEQGPREARDPRSCALHQTPPVSKRVTHTVSIPVETNVTTAIRERLLSRLRPHTP